MRLNLPPPSLVNGHTAQVTRHGNGNGKLGVKALALSGFPTDDDDDTIVRSFLFSQTGVFVRESGPLAVH